MQTQASNNKRIAKNSILLYFRMLLTMGISLFTSRVILQTLGVENYGIYNVVGGIVTLFTFVNGGMVSATQRYLTFEIGKGNTNQINKVFSTSIQIHALISLVIVLLGETIGLWFLYNKLVIPAERMSAAFWIYQFSIIACVIRIMSIPYNAIIIAHEKMSAFAYISILEVTLKLAITYAIYITPWDKLISYALLMLGIHIIIRSIYTIYCKKHFKEAYYKHQIDKSLLKEMTSFAGWSLTTSIAYVLSSQGLNMMLNIFFGPVVNAARAIAVQIQGTVRQFVSSVQVAINPQITKYYAASQLATMHVLMSRCARFSFFLLYIMSLPILIETNYILSIWLGEVPAHTVAFTRLILVLTLLYPFSNPLIIANQATGKVKIFEMVSGILLLALLPLSYVALKCGMPAYFVYLIQIFLEFATLISRLLLVRRDVNLSLTYFVKSAILPAIVVASISCILPILTYYYMDKDIIGFIITTSASIISTTLVVILLGITANERKAIFSKLMIIIKKITK